MPTFNRFIQVTPNIQLTPKQAAFVIEYLKDRAPRRAAEASGHNPNNYQRLLDNKDIWAAIEFGIISALERSTIDAETLLLELHDNHMIARQRGNIAQSNTAIALMLKHSQVDGMASDKVNVNLHTDQDTMDRLNDGRAAVAKARAAKGDEISFR